MIFTFGCNDIKDQFRGFDTILSSHSCRWFILGNPTRGDGLGKGFVIECEWIKCAC